ncbi:hypothetical protein CA13_00620 [Planctomycetes bacterium CA13]|uniref:Lipocalin-like domain-containing protein n=1 Tax=Novipirellula herctigrandis TaxID=2527986 RepID=A0A5C5YV86_9BACT|nr:hypothetical protein CA13_00620 [Planctomycetes bacterium CA13]
MMQRIQFFTALGLLALTATCSFADRPTNVSTNALTGVWHHPFPGVGHWETLTFRKDGTFERVIRHRVGASRIAGWFTVANDGNMTLAIRERGLVDGVTSVVKSTDKRSRIRAHIVIKNGNDMMLTNRDLSIPQYGNDNYYVYSRDYLREDEYNRRRKANIERMHKMLDDVTANGETEASTQSSK